MQEGGRVPLCPVVLVERSPSLSLAGWAQWSFSWPHQGGGEEGRERGREEGRERGREE